MPKFKRLQKKKNSDYLASTSQGVESIPSVMQPQSRFLPHLTTPFVGTTQLSQSIHSASHSVIMDQTASHPTTSAYAISPTDQEVHSTSHPSLMEQNSPQQASTIQPALRKRIGRESQSHWTVEAIDSEKNVKKLKLKKSEVLNLSGFCGILACDCSLFPINFEKWSSVPMSYLNRVFDQIIKEMRKKNMENQKKQTIPHTGGSKPNATRRAEMMVETGQRPGRAQIYLATHKNKDGAYVNEAAKEICEKIELTLSQSTIDESVISPNDAVGKVLGKEHSGRVRCMGLGVVPSKVFKQERPRFGGANASSSEGSCSSKCQENHNQMMNAHIQMMNAFKAYMIMKEGMIPEQFAGLFASPSTNSPTTPSDAASEPFPPTNA